MTDTAPLKVVVCDDERGRREAWGEGLDALLGKKVAVEMLREEDWAGSWDPLIKRRAAARARRKDTDQQLPFEALDDTDTLEGDSMFDQAEVLVVDYDLFGFDDKNYITGAQVAYMARCFSRVKIIVGVNEHGRNPFDLTLKPDAGSFADVSIGETQVANHGLWLPDPTDTYRPWTWPCLTEIARQRDQQVAIAFERPELHVVEACGLAQDWEQLPRSVLALLERGDEPGKRTSLQELARGRRLGYRERDEAPDRHAVARVAAARTSRWLQQHVLPLADVLIDLPHIAARNPSLISGELTERGDLRELTAKSVGSAAIADEALRTWLADTGPWLDRPAFRWGKVRNDIELRSRRPPPDRYVFCEDLSRFEQESRARRFMSALDSSAPQRWIADATFPEVQGVSYRPLSRLAA